MPKLKVIHVAHPGRYWVEDSRGVIVETFESGREAMERAEWLAKLHSEVYKVYDSETTEDELCKVYDSETTGED